MKIKYLIISVLSFLPILPSFVFAETLTFRDHGKIVRSIPLEELKKRDDFGKIEVFEPHEEKIVTYEGWRATALLDSVYGKKWKNAEEILFTCVDGYQPSLPVQKFKEYESYLVISRQGSEKFLVHNKLQNEKEVPLWPFYLVWNNMKAPSLKEEGASGWPYQVTTLDLISFSERFPKMAPPDNTSASVKRGFLSFRKYCMNCHKMNGEGGDKSIDLVSVTEYRSGSWLNQWLDNPSAVRPQTAMPRLNTSLKNRKKVIEDIVAYLKVMSKHKK